MAYAELQDGRLTFAGAKQAESAIQRDSQYVNSGNTVNNGGVN